MFVVTSSDIGDVVGLFFGIVVVTAIFSVIVQWWWLILLILGVLTLVLYLVLRNIRKKEQLRYQAVVSFLRERYNYPDDVEVSPRTVRLQEEINNGAGYPRMLETSVRMDKKHPEYEKELRKYRMPEL